MLKSQRIGLVSFLSAIQISSSIQRAIVFNLAVRYSVCIIAILRRTVVLVLTSWMGRGNAPATPRAASSARQKNGARKQRSSTPPICFFFFPGALPGSPDMDSRRHRSHPCLLAVRYLLLPRFWRRPLSGSQTETSALGHSLKQNAELKETCHGSVLEEGKPYRERSSWRSSCLQKTCTLLGCSRSECSGRPQRNEGSMATCGDDSSMHATVSHNAAFWSRACGGATSQRRSRKSAAQRSSTCAGQRACGRDGE